MHQLVDALDARSSRLLMMNAQANEVQESFVVNHDERYMQQYTDYYVNKCPWRPELALKAKGLLYTTFFDFSCKQKEFRKTEFYNDWAKPQDIEHGICGTVLQDPKKTVQLLVQRNRDAGHFTHLETNAVNRLVPHIQNAIRLTEKADIIQAAQKGAAELADRYSLPFALIDEQMKVCFITPIMERKVTKSLGLTLASGRLAANDANENARLNRLLRESILTASSSGNSAGGVVSINADRSVGLRMQVMPFPVEVDNLLTVTKGVFAVVFLTSSSLKFSLSREQLSMLYNLTERESQLATLLCEGLSLEQIAEHQGVKASTLRKQLKSIYAKTDTHRQGELIVTLLNSFAANRY